MSFCRFYRALAHIFPVVVCLQYLCQSLVQKTSYFRFGYIKNGEFIFDLSDICLSIKENKPGKYGFHIFYFTVTGVKFSPIPSHEASQATET